MKENELVAAIVKEFPALDGRVSSPQPMRVVTDWLSRE